MLAEPLMASGGTVLPVCEGGASVYASILDQMELCTLSRDAILTINDPTPRFQSSQVCLCLLEEDGTVVDRVFVGGSGGGNELDQVRSAFGFSLNLEDKGWWTGKRLLLGVTAEYTWPDGSKTQWSTAFWAAPEGALS